MRARRPRRHARRRGQQWRSCPHGRAGVDAIAGGLSALGADQGGTVALLIGNRLLNCAIIIQGGRVLGVAPKSYLPNYREFYEKRWFAAGDDAVDTLINRPHWPGADEDGDIAYGTDLHKVLPLLTAAIAAVPKRG